MMMGEEYVGCLGMNAATHPHHRGKGMMKRLQKELAGEAAARGLAVAYGIVEITGPMMRANLAVTGGSKRVGPRRMRSFLLVLNLRRILARRDLAWVPDKLGAIGLRATHKAKGLPPPGRVEIEQVSEFDESFDELWNAVSSSLDKALVIKRSRAYLNWRYSLHPEYKYLTWVARENDILLGYVIGRHDRGEDSHRGIIADIFGFHHRRDVMGALASSVVQHFEERDAELVRCQLSDGHPCTKVLEDIGFVARSSKRWLDFYVVSPAVGVDQAWLPRGENHMITWGDAHADNL